MLRRLMETDDTPAGEPTVLDSASADPFSEASETPATPPPVVAVMVTRNPGPWFEDSLVGLAGQDYPDLTVLVIDTGSDVDPTPRVAALLPHAYVRRTTAAGFAAGANEALATVEGAALLLLCHDDVALEQSCVRLLVEEAFRSNGAVLGPKLVTADNPEILLDVGLAIDWFGVPFSDIEPGELDQEQHDGVRDVFYVPSAVMLVRADLFGVLGGFDAATFPGAEDLDLCWRARLLGGRVLVVPDARAAHRRAGDEKPSSERAASGTADRNRLRAVLKAYSLPTLLWTVPLGFVLVLAEALVSLVTGRAGRARALVGAWFSGFAHLGELRRIRREVQRTRAVRDRELRYLQVRGSARLTTFVSKRLHAEDHLQTFTSAGRGLVGAAARRARGPMALAAFAFAACYVIGSRSLLTDHVPAVGSFLPWPGVSRLAAAFGSGWRYSGLGHATPAPAALGLMTTIGVTLFGKVGLAQTLVIVGALPLGAFGAYRATRSLSPSPVPAAATAFAYAVNPIARNMLATGRLGPLVFYAVAPFLFTVLLRAAGIEIGMAEGGSTTRRSLHRIVGAGVLTAVATAMFPSALPLVLVMAASIVLSAPLVGGLPAAGRVLGAAALAGVIAVLLLLPWPVSLLGSGDRTAIGWVFRPRLGLSEILQFHTGPAGAGWSGWMLLGAAALPLLVGSGPRLAWATRAWVLALASFALVWLPVRWAPDGAVPAPEGVLVLAALGLAVAVGTGVGVFVDDLRRSRFGWRQLASVIAVTALVFPAFGFVADVGSGRWRAPANEWHRELAFTSSGRDDGAFRMLWLGAPSILPIDPGIRPSGLGYGVTRNGPGEAIDLWPAPTRGADRLLAESIDLVTTSRTNRLGHLLAPMGVRYIAVPDRRGADDQVLADLPSVRVALANQLDLTRLETRTGLVVYENQAWAPLGAVLVDDAAGLPVDSKDPKQAASRTDLTGAAPVALPGTTEVAVPAGTVLWSEAFSSGWRASASGQSVAHVRTFGWANGYVLGVPGRISLRYARQGTRDVVVVLELAAWLLVLGGLFVTRSRPDDSGSGGSARRGESRVAAMAKATS